MLSWRNAASSWNLETLELYTHDKVQNYYLSGHVTFDETSGALSPGMLTSGR